MNIWEKSCCASYIVGDEKSNVFNLALLLKQWPESGLLLLIFCANSELTIMFMKDAKITLSLEGIFVPSFPSQKYPFHFLVLSAYCHYILIGLSLHLINHKQWNTLINVQYKFSFFTFLLSILDIIIVVFFVFAVCKHSCM